MSPAGQHSSSASLVFSISVYTPNVGVAGFKGRRPNTMLEKLQVIFGSMSDFHDFSDGGKDECRQLGSTCRFQNECKFARGTIEWQIEKPT